MRGDTEYTRLVWGTLRRLFLFERRLRLKSCFFLGLFDGCLKSPERAIKALLTCAEWRFLGESRERFHLLHGVSMMLLQCEYTGFEVITSALLLQYFDVRFPASERVASLFQILFTVGGEVVFGLLIPSMPFVGGLIFDFSEFILELLGGAAELLSEVFRMERH